ncbi:helix-turn-helix transcriptional regulator [Reichenbachiella versicolor]|uniref:helix-turn-helix transcriptional regulator n=1 Tax=Reichenbachiella versicolor TaxID=1821036 RepID=UPI000D6E61FF|nr:response regulator transcription factor [Reichenbachiella versicolor]
MRIQGDLQDFIELKVIEDNASNSIGASEASSLTVLWFLEDDNQLLIDGKEYTFSKNQIVFFTEFHRVKGLNIKTSNFLRFNRPFYCVIDHDDEVSCKGVLFFGASRLPVVQIPDDMEEHFGILWKMFSIEMDAKDNLQIEMLRMMLKRYLILCTRLYKEQHESTGMDTHHDIVREFNFMVEHYYKTKHTVAEYADLLNKSPKTISNIFAKIGSKTPLSYIHDRKLLEARRLLFYSDLQIQEIADQLGFEDIQTFSRFFKKQEGVSPKLFRENLAEG